MGTTQTNNKAKNSEIIGSVPRCQICSSERVVKIAAVCWNPDSGLWEIERVSDTAHCFECGAKTTLNWVQADTPPQLRIRELNDRFRTTGVGNGSILITNGIKDGGESFMRAVLDAVQSYADFNDDNDPWGEHDFGSFEVEGEKIFWKFNYYTPDLMAGSENPANEMLTHRILTIMLASEY